LTTRSIKLRPDKVQKSDIVNATPEKIGAGLFAKDKFPLTSMKETPIIQTPQTKIQTLRASIRKSKLAQLQEETKLGCNMKLLRQIELEAALVI
jgi:hypothetical protein